MIGPSARWLAGVAGCALLLACGPVTEPRAMAEAAAAVPLPPVPAVAPAAGPAAPMPWPDASDCRRLAAAVAALPPVQRARLSPDGAPLALAVQGSGAPFTATDAVLPDVPLPLDDGRAGCVLVVERATSARAVPRLPLAHEMVRSTYRAGGAGRANPDHRRLQRELRRLEAPDAMGFIATGDPATDLIGLVAGTVLQGIGAAVDGRAAAAVRERLAATPATLSEPVWEPYTFSVTMIEAARQGRVRARLVDRAAATAWLLDQPLIEQRRFRVADGRRARDRSLLEGGGSDLAGTADLAVWEQAGLRPSLAWLLGSVAALPGTGIPVTTTELAPRRDDPPAGSTAMVEAEVGRDGVRRYRLRPTEAVSPVRPAP